MEYHGQIHQDKWVIDYFGENYKGFFIDIGANDGVNISNTYVLEKLGWSGVCVEANSEYKDVLPRNRKNSQCILSAISDYDGKCHFHNNGLFGRIGEPNGVTDCMTMKTLLIATDSPKIIDYLSIDVEGAELKVLKGIPFNEYKFKLLTIEHNAYAYGRKLKDDIFEFLTPLDYIRVVEINGDFKHIPMGQEDWYIHKDYIKLANH